MQIGPPVHFRHALTDRQFRHLLRQICVNAGGPIDLAEAILIARWCDTVVARATYVDGIQRGHLRVRWPRDARTPCFTLTPKGLAHLERIAPGAKP